MRWLLVLFVFALIIAPLAVPNPALHIDEVANWLDRVVGFREAMWSRDYAATVRTEHPGVTTMALGGVGLTVLNLLSPASGLLDIETMYAVRYPVILANALALTLAFVVLWRLVGWRVALLAAVLWASSPILRWYLRLLHIDGMSTTFMWLAFLLLMLALHTHTRTASPAAVNWRLLVVAGFVGGLAGLTRFTAAYLVGIVGVLALLNLFAYRREMTPRLFAVQIALPVLVFVGVQATTWAALYPGMWAAPGEVYAETVHGIDNATSPHEEGNYYMGQPVEAPGWDFYLWALLIRLTPFTVAGVALAVIAAVRGASREQWRVWLAVTVYILVYALIMSSQPKKFDRYILPVFPALHLTAAFGWVWLAGVMTKLRPIREQWAWGVGIVVMVGYGLWFFPQDYAYTNPMVGAARAEHVLLIAAGGEGMEQVAQAVEQVSGVANACGQFVYTRYGDNLVYNAPCARIVRLDRLEVDVLGNAYYIVRTISYRQRDQWTAPVFDSTEPLDTVRIHGINYAEIYDAEDIRAFIRANGGDDEEWNKPGEAED